MRRAIRAVLAAGLLAAAAVTAFAVAGPAAADTQICDQYGTTTIGGRYVVMNNRWGTSAQQCINVTGTGFAITSQQGTGNTSGAPVSYPAVYIGCHYTNCSPGHQPADAGQPISSATSSIDYTLRVRRDLRRRVRHLAGPDAQEGRRQPAGDHDLVQPAGLDPADRLGRSAPPPSAAARWEVWQRQQRRRTTVVSYVAPSPITQLELQRPGLHQRREEPRRDHQLVVPDQHPGRLRALDRRRRPGGDQLLARRSTAAATNQHPADHHADRPTPTAPAARRPAGSPTRPTSWAAASPPNVTVANTGSSAINGWTLGFTLPGRPGDHQLVERQPDRHAAAR